MLRFAEELLLLLLKEEPGEAAVAETNLGYALAGAVLMDLAIEGRIDTDLQRLALVDRTPLDDDLLDPALEAIAAAASPHDAEHWVRHLAGDARRIEEGALARLREMGILQADEAGVRLSSRTALTRQYPAHEGSLAGEGEHAEQEVRLRIMRILFSEDIPAPRDIVIICLANACGFFDRALSKEERAECAARLDVVQRLDLIGQAVAKAVRHAAEAEEKPTSPAKGEPIPSVAGLPFLGQALALARSPSRFLVKSYRRHGPVFRVRLPGHKLVVLAGAEANRFVQRKGRVHLRSRDPWNSALAEVGAASLITTLDGADHTRMRQALARGYSRKTLEDKMDAAMAVCRRHAHAWSAEQPIGGKVAIQRLVVDQLGTILASYSPQGYFDDMTTFLDLLLLTRIAKIQPMFLHRRRYAAAWKRMNELFEITVREHRPGGSLADAEDLIADVLALHDADPQFLPETDLLMAAMGPFIAGVDTVAVTTSFVLYALLKDAELGARARAEADALFGGGGTPSIADLAQLDVTRRVTMEVLRLFSPVPAMVRTASNGFEVAGRRVAAGENLMIAMSVTHHLEEHFPAPERFDIDRYLPERAEHRQPDVYTPYGLGHHRCLATGFAEAQLILNAAYLMHVAEFALHPPDYEMRTQSVPTLRPKPSFRIRKLRMRG